MALSNGLIAWFQPTWRTGGGAGAGPEAQDAPQETGTVAVSSGVVTLSGATWPPIVSDFPYHIAFDDATYSEAYTIASRDSDTQITLDDTSVNVSAGTAYVLTKNDLWFLCDHHDADRKLLNRSTTGIPTPTNAALGNVGSAYALSFTKANEQGFSLPDEEALRWGTGKPHTLVIPFRNNATLGKTLYENIQGSNLFKVRIAGPGGLKLRIDAGTGVSNQLVSDAALAEGWFTLFVTDDGAGNIAFRYVSADGATDVSKTGTYTSFTPASGTTYFGQSGTAGVAFDGDIAGFRLWSRVLSTDEQDRLLGSGDRAVYGGDPASLSIGVSYEDIDPTLHNATRKAIICPASSVLEVDPVGAISGEWGDFSAENLTIPGGFFASLIDNGNPAFDDTSFISMDSSDAADTGGDATYNVARFPGTLWGFDFTSLPNNATNIYIQPIMRMSHDSAAAVTFLAAECGAACGHFDLEDAREASKRPVQEGTGGGGGNATDYIASTDGGLSSGYMHAPPAANATLPLAASSGFFTLRGVRPGGNASWRRSTFVYPSAEQPSITPAMLKRDDFRMRVGLATDGAEGDTLKISFVGLLVSFEGGGAGGRSRSRSGRPLHGAR